MFSHAIESLKSELAVAIHRKYELDTGGASTLDEQIVDDEDGKLSLFEDPEIYDLLDALVSEQEDKLKKLRKGRKEYDDLLKEELEEVLREMTMEENVAAR